MSKSRIIKKLKKKHPKLSDYQLKKIYQRILKTLKEGLKKDQSIELRSIGTFFKKEIKETESKSWYNHIINKIIPEEDESKSHKGFTTKK